MLVSVVVPIYNMAPYLDRCLSSVLNQTHKKIEVILIDDCSTDNSFEIIKDFERRDNRIKVFQNEKNSLIGVSRNLGIREANGEFIWFVDADDWIELDAIASIVAKLIENRNTEVLLVGYVEENAENIKKEKVPYFDGDSENALPYYLQWRKGFCGMVLGYVYSRRFLLENQITFPEHVFFEDIAFNAKVCHFAQHIEMVPKVLYYYNKANETSITKKYSKQKIQHLLEGYEAIKRFMVSEKIFREYQNLFINRFLVFGLSGGFRMYFSLSGKDKKYNYFKKEFFGYRNLPIFSKKTLSRLQATAQSFEKHETELAYFAKP